jgi:uncharacterized lipoprotein NlpE involved in copper resistance
MGWTVNVVENTLKTSEKTFEKIEEFLDGEYYYLIGQRTFVRKVT